MIKQNINIAIERNNDTERIINKGVMLRQDQTLYTELIKQYHPVHVEIYTKNSLMDNSSKTKENNDTSDILLRYALFTKLHEKQL